MTNDSFWDDNFHSIAFLAFAEVARECGGWPDSEKVRLLAYKTYEEELAAGNEG